MPLRLWRGGNVYRSLKQAGGNGSSELGVEDIGVLHREIGIAKTIEAGANRKRISLVNPRSFWPHVVSLEFGLSSR